MDLESLIEAIKQEARRRGDTETAPGLMIARPSATASPSQRPASRTLPEVSLPSGAHIADFLPFYGEEFLNIAYRTLFWRNPDPDGKSHYLQMLLTGRMTRWELLMRLRLSSEGRAKQVKVRRLWLACFTALLYRIPVFGWVLGIIVHVLALPIWLHPQTQNELLLAHLERWRSDPR